MPRPEDANGFRAAWAETQQRWAATIERAHTLDEERRCIGPGHPKAGRWPVRRCLTAQVNEEWRHRDYAERDLARLTARSG